MSEQVPFIIVADVSRRSPLKRAIAERDYCAGVCAEHLAAGDLAVAQEWATKYAAAANLVREGEGEVVSRHFPRADSACLHPEQCARSYHGSPASGLGVGDTCECCGQVVTEPLVWEPVHERAGRRGRIVYWRLKRGGQSIGAVIHREYGWEGKTYGPGGNHDGGKLFGSFQSWQAARRAVETEVLQAPI